MTLGFSLPAIALVLEGHIDGVIFLRARLELVMALFGTRESLCTILKGRVAKVLVAFITALLLETKLSG